MEYNLHLEIDYIKNINPAILSKDLSVMSSCILKNEGKESVSDLTVCIKGEMIENANEAVSVLPANGSVATEKLRITFDRKKTDSITEAVDTSFTISISVRKEEVFHKDYPIRILPRDYWPGLSTFPEILAVFVTPNVPAVAHVLQNAAKWMEKFTGNSALDEYQTKDVRRARYQVAAIYEALREESIVYATPPASFEERGQRVRTAETVVKDKLGTCLDLSLLYASCLEQCGLYPMVIFTPGHAFVGCWLEGTYYQQTTGDDSSYLSKNIANGISRLVVVESTFITTSQPATFEDAVASAEKTLSEGETTFIDIHRCRLDKILPLTKTSDNEWKNDGVSHANATTDVNNIQKIDVSQTSSGPLTREQIWERKLLDISLRNNLINLKLGRKALPFISFDIDKVEDFLQDGRDYHIIPNPQDKLMEPNGQGIFDSRQFKEQYQAIVTGNRKDGKLTSYLNSTELGQRLKNFYRESRNSLEENGANTLFLALGILRWFETEKSQQPRYAPILLLPVDIIRRSNNDYIIRSRDEDITFNTTLAEMLKQNFHVSIPGIDPLPEDDHGCDVLKVLTIVRSCIMRIHRWDVLEESMLGLFSFSKFVMWNDVHSNIDLMRDNPVIKALLTNGTWQEDEKPVDISHYDEDCPPSDNAIPIDVDSSQLEAVLESGQGHSFILYGPPGTGKSQTITNMITNALFHGKRVLFVAEKMAALEVVQRRLEKIGLSPFCLELHSNKVTKSHFLEQLDQALSLTRINEPTEYAQVANDLMHERQKLSKFNALIHEKTDSGLSLYDCITCYSSLKGTPDYPSAEFMKDFDVRKMDSALAEIKKAGTLLSVVGKPSEHPLFGLNVNGNSKEVEDTLRANLPALLEEVDGIETAIQNINKALMTSLPNTAVSIPFICKLQKILQNWNTEILFEDYNQLSSEWDAANSSWFLPKFFKKKKIVKYLHKFNDRVAAKDVEEFLKLLTVFHDDADRLNIHLLEGVAIPFDKTVITGDTKAILSVRQYNGTMSGLQKVCSIEDDFESLKRMLPRWITGLDKLRDWSLWCALVKELREHNMAETVKALEQSDAGSIQKIADSFAKGCYGSLAHSIIDGHEELQMFKGILFEDQIRKYKELDNKFKDLTIKMLYYRLASRVPSQTTGVSDASELGILKRYIHSKGRGVSVRKIIDQIPELLPRLCPVMLMSPISVAQFIDLHNRKFDIVCFDEASQMPTSEAVGAIARGNALICVGDPKQMPPTSFFSSNTIDEEDAENDDMESILEDCITISMPARYLNWHYRSKHESLIAFSNLQYYDGKLYTFPSVDDRARKVRYVHVNGTYDYGKTRSNAAEADTIVKEVVKRLQSDSKESIGIVAFSKVQQNLIEDKLGDALAKYPELEKKAYNGDEPIFIKNLENVQGDERDVILFSVGYGPDKNGKVSMNFGPLNNVGGERRLNVAVSRARNEMVVYTIMEPEMIDLKRTKALGVAGLKNFLKFAKTGELPLRNSQVSETRKDIADVIGDELRSKGYKVDTHVGHSAFKVDIAIVDPKDSEKYILGILCDGDNFYQAKTEREREIGQPSFLHHLGWNLLRVWSLDWYIDKKQVMDSILKAIRDSANGNKNNDEKEKETSRASSKYMFKSSETIPQQDKQPEDVRIARPYKQYSYTFNTHAKWNTETLFSARRELHLDDVFLNTIKEEQPITLKLLSKRVANFHTINVVTKKFLSEALRFLKDLPVHMDTEYSDDNPTFWVSEDDKFAFKDIRENGGRKIEEIPEIEIHNAIKFVIEQQVSLPTDDLVKATSVLFGFSHTGSLINRAISKVIDVMLSRGELSKAENGNIK